MIKAASAQQSNNFDLKHQTVDLLPGRSRELTHVTIEDLEGMRTDQAIVPASKHGLEVICGASCETSAQ